MGFYIDFFLSGYLVFLFFLPARFWGLCGFGFDFRWDDSFCLFVEILVGGVWSGSLGWDGMGWEGVLDFFGGDFVEWSGTEWNRGEDGIEDEYLYSDAGKSGGVFGCWVEGVE